MQEQYALHTVAHVLRLFLSINSPLRLGLLYWSVNVTPKFQFRAGPCQRKDIGIQNGDWTSGKGRRERMRWETWQIKVLKVTMFAISHNFESLLFTVLLVFRNFSLYLVTRIGLKYRLLVFINSSLLFVCPLFLTPDCECVLSLSQTQLLLQYVAYLGNFSDSVLQQFLCHFFFLLSFFLC